MFVNACKTMNKTAVVRRALLALTTASGIQIASGGTSLAAPTLLAGQFSGGAHGLSLRTQANQGAPLTFNSAEESCPCRGTNGVLQTASVPEASIRNVLTASTNTASAIATKTANTATTTESTTVTAASLFGGLITADAITAEASVGATTTTLTTASSGTKLVNLVVANHSIDPNVPDNTQVALPGLGMVTVKAVSPTVTAQNALVEVDGLLITITEKNKYGLAIGTRVTVGDAIAGYARAQPAAVLEGYSQTANLSGDASAAGPVSSNVGAALGMANCSGTGGVTETRSTENLVIPNLATVALAKVTVFGGPVGSASIAKTTSTVSNVSLLNGLITAGTLTAVAQESRSGTTSTASTAGSGFTALKIAGVTIPSVSRPNLTINLPGYGMVTVNEQVSTPAAGAVRVTELDVFINQTNVLGIPVSTHLTLGTAFAVAQRF